MKNKKIKRFLLVIVLILVLGIGIFLGTILEKNKTYAVQNERTSQIVEVTVGTQTIENTLTSSGEVMAGDTEKLELNTYRYFKTMCVEINDIVKKDENILQYTNGTYLTADYDCIISSYSVPETGKICTSSNYIEVQNLENMKLQIQVNENEINKIAKDQDVNIEISALDNKVYTGKIKTINNVGNYSSSGTTFVSVVEFENDGNVKPGMSATCTIILEKEENCIAIPIEAVQVKDNQKYVVVVNGETTENINIETGISNDSYVQIKSGLNGGEKIQMVQLVNTTRNNTTNNGRMNFQNMNSGNKGNFQMNSGMPNNMGGPSGNMPPGMPN